MFSGNCLIKWFRLNLQFLLVYLIRFIPVENLNFNGVYYPFNNALLLVIASITDISLFFLVCNYGNI